MIETGDGEEETVEEERKKEHKWETGGQRKIKQRETVEEAIRCLTKPRLELKPSGEPTAHLEWRSVTRRAPCVSLFNNHTKAISNSQTHSGQPEKPSELPSISSATLPNFAPFTFIS